MEDKKKVEVAPLGPRDKVLEAEIDALRATYRAEVATLKGEARSEVDKVLRRVLNERAANGKSYDACMKMARETREKRSREISKAYEQALRQAQSDRDKAHGQLLHDYTEAQAQLDKELAEKNGPLDAEYEKVNQEASQRVGAKIKALQDAFSEKVKPMADELRTIREAQKIAQKTKTSELPDPAPPAQVQQ